MAGSTRTPSPSESSSSGRRWWPTAVAAVGAAVAGVLAVHSPSWAVGLGTAAGLFAAIREVTRC